MDIRPGRVEDIDQIIPIVEEFHAETLDRFGFSGDEDKVRALAVACIDTSFMAWEGDRLIGVIGGQVVVPSSGNEKIWQEYIWYVLPEYRSVGLKLYAKMEQKCRDMEITKMVMVHMCDKIGDKVASVYDKIGYRPFEIHYVKEL